MLTPQEIASTQKVCDKLATPAKNAATRRNMSQIVNKGDFYFEQM